MKKRNLLIYIVFSMLLPFLFINNVKADYKAIVINPTTASCSLDSNSTGFCFFANSELNSIVNNVYWLDTGDEVTVYENVDTIEAAEEDVCGDYYVYAGYYSKLQNQVINGYYCNKYLTSETELLDEIKNNFPESYWNKLSALKLAHPNWSFVPINVGLDFSEAVTNETYGDRSLLQGYNLGYLSLAPNSFNYKEDYFIAYDGIGSSSPWYLANYDTIAYYMDPRNFLSDMYIFQFQALTYDDSISDESLSDSICVIFKNDYLSNFVDDFIEAGKISTVNPIYLASLAKQEVGVGSEPGAATNGLYNGMYNFYNIGALSGENPVLNGLYFAVLDDPDTLRPWDTPNKAIVGGAMWIYYNYISAGQVTSYFKKYDVVYDYLVSIGRTPEHANYIHQYMQNIAAPSSEATSTYRSYYKSELLDLSYTFYIPVYENMPEKTELPNKDGWPNNYLKSITINGNNVPEFDGDVDTYTYELDINNPVIKISAEPVSSLAKVSGKGTFTLEEDTTKVIKVTAQNGDVKKYKIKVKLVGTKLEPPTDVVSTLNNAGIKNGSKYITGLTVGSNIKIIKEKILIANPDAVVELQNSKGEEKNDGIVATGDKVIITVGEETKTYEIVIYGDVNGDGKIAATDYVKIKNHIMGTTTLSGAYMEAADVDKNAKIAATDYVKIKNSIMGTGQIEQ